MKKYQLDKEESDILDAIEEGNWEVGEAQEGGAEPLRPDRKEYVSERPKNEHPDLKSGYGPYQNKGRGRGASLSDAGCQYHS